MYYQLVLRWLGGGVDRQIGQYDSVGEAYAIADKLNQAEPFSTIPEARPLTESWVAVVLDCRGDPAQRVVDSREGAA